jgi:cyanophycinase
MLILIGGAEDRKGDRAILKKVISFTGGRRVAVITTASDFPVDLGRDYHRAFISLGVQEVTLMDIRYREDADHHGHLSAVSKADVIFFTGGDQVQLLDVLEGTALAGRIRRRLHDGATVAGTSAGAAAAGEVTIYSGDGEGHLKGTVGHRKAFGFLPGVVVDTHFMERGRLARLAQYLSSGGLSQGIGLAEDTAAVVYPEGKFEVVGKGVVAALSAEGMAWSGYREAAAREPITVDGLRLSYLGPGSLFDLSRWGVLTEALKGAPKSPAGRSRPEGAAKDVPS